MQPQFQETLLEFKIFFSFCGFSCEMPLSLLCLIGLPGSGKTTLAGSLKGYFDAIDVDCLCFEYDLHIADIHCTQGDWKSQRRKLLEEIRRVAGEMKENCRKSVMILDDNFYYRSMRYEVYRVAKELLLGFGQIFLNSPFDLCCSRNSSRPKPVSFEVMCRMKSLIEPPEPSKNSWEKHSLTLSSVTSNLDEIVKLLANTWEQPCVPEPETRNPPQDNSAIHYVDLALRKIVKTITLSAPREQRPQITQSLTHRKKSLLDDVKMNNIELPVVESNSDVVATYVNVLEAYFSDLLHE